MRVVPVIRAVKEDPLFSIDNNNEKISDYINLQDGL